MKWQHPRTPKDGHTKDVDRFLWLPLRIGKETRWLERAKYRVRCEPYPGNDGFELQWVPSQWLN